MDSRQIMDHLRDKKDVLHSLTRLYIDKCYEKLPDHIKMFWYGSKEHCAKYRTIHDQTADMMANLYINSKPKQTTITTLKKAKATSPTKENKTSQQDNTTISSPNRKPSDDEDVIMEPVTK